MVLATDLASFMAAQGLAYPPPSSTFSLLDDSVSFFLCARIYDR